MATILIAGVETVVGANLAAMLAEQNRVVGLSSSPGITIDGCEVEFGSISSRQTARDLIANIQPDHVIHCGAAAVSSWTTSHQPNQTDVDAVRHWSQAAAEFGSQLTLISSDTIFTGPWLFHGEDCESICTSSAAATIRAMETATREAASNSLIIRTHCFGYSPATSSRGWIESTLQKLEQGKQIDLGHTSHATPIHAGQLAEYIQLALEQELEGVYHIAGAERVNQLQLTMRLADAFGISAPQCNTGAALERRPSGFGQSEHSLDTRKIRRRLGVSMPMLREGIDRLVDEDLNGSRSRLSSTRMKVA